MTSAETYSEWTMDEKRLWKRNFKAHFGPLRESKEERERSWQEWRKENPPLPPLRERFGINTGDDRPYIFLSSCAEFAFVADARNPREHFPFGVAITPEMTGQDIVNALRGKKTPNLKEFSLVCLGGKENKGKICSMAGYSGNIFQILEGMGIKPDRRVSETEIRLSL
jgi:hypothetical protein